MNKTSALIAAFVLFSITFITTPSAYADSAWVPSGPDIYFDSGNVGIGGTPADAQLDIMSSAPRISLTNPTVDRVMVQNLGDQFLINLEELVSNNVTPLIRMFKSGTVNDGPNGGDILIGQGIPAINSYYPTLAVGNYTFTQGTTYGSTAIGHRALRVGTGAFNTALGYEAGQNLGVGDLNAILGGSSGLTEAASNGISGTSWSGVGNTFVGIGVAGNIATDAVLDNNILIGVSGANQFKSGSYNILIGSNADLPLDNGSNQMAIGNIVYGTDISGTHKVISPGRIGIGTQTPDARLSIKANDGDTNTLLFSIAGTQSLYTVNDVGHHIYGGTEPTVTTCGSGTTLNGNDNRGRIKAGTGSITSCVITFAHAWDKAPVCFANKETGPAAVITANSSKTSVTFKSLTSLAGETFGYSCDGF